MRELCTAVFALCLFWTGACTSGSSDEGIQGQWQSISAQDSGNKLPDSLMRGYRLTVTRDSFLLSHKRRGRMTVGSYQLTPTKDPKWLDIETEHLTIAAIYKRRGDTLRIVMPEGPVDRLKKRPTAITSEKVPSPNDRLITFLPMFNRRMASAGLARAALSTW